MAGIYAGDAEQMSLRATFPRFYELEQEDGSVIRGMMAARRARAQKTSDERSRHTMFVTLKNGLGDLVTGLATHIQQAGGVLKAGVQAEALRVRSHQAGCWMYDVICADGTALSAEALDAVMVYEWPGNVRELQNALEHAVVLSRGSLLEPQHLPERITRRKKEPLVAERAQTNPSLDRIERAYIMFVL